MRLKFLLLAGACLLLASCSDISVPKAKSTTGRAPSVAEVPGDEDTVRGADDPPIVTLELGSRLHEHRLTRTEDLPGSIIVPTTNLNAVPVTAALQAVLNGTDVSLSWEAGSFSNRLVTVTNLSGPLPKVVDKICASAKVFCSYRNGLLEMKDKETFIVELPSVPSTKTASGAATNTMADTIGELAGEKVKIDQQGGNLLYTTDVDGQEQVHEYLMALRHGRPLLVMQLYIWEVTLNRENGMGINWNSFKFDQIGKKAQSLVVSGLTGFSSLTSPGVSLGAKLSGRIDADTVIQFLATQGQVQTVSNPQLTFVSGSNAEFRVGGKQRYISQIGTLTSSVSGSSSSSSSNTVSTDSIDTGLKVTVGGAFESGVISALLELELQDVISLNPTTMDNGTVVDLPETTERKVSTSLRVRPGDNLVLAGLVSSRDDDSREGVPLPFGAKINTFSHDTLKNSELVILVKPSVVLFTDTETDDNAPQRVGAARARGKAQPMPDAVVIDKDGAKTLAMPTGASYQSAEAGPVDFAPLGASSARPELMAAAPDSSPLSDVSIAPSSDGAPVDKRLLQRGFSHAYDQMLAPSDGEGAR